jgi:YtkA-like
MRWAAFLVLAACTSEPDPDEPVDCSKVTNADTFVVGIEKPGQVFRFRLMAVEPAPPARYENTWTLALVDGAERPITDADIRVTPYMPKHDHVSAIHAVSTQIPGSAWYKVERVNFSMPGVWETTISATAGSETDSAMFRFCIP